MEENELVQVSDDGDKQILLDFLDDFCTYDSLSRLVLDNFECMDVLHYVFEATDGDEDALYSLGCDEEDIEAFYDLFFE